MTRNKVKAFTIMEVTITMLITAIVIGITYTAYSIVSQSYISFHKKNDNLAVIMRIDELLKKDFAKATTIDKTSNGLFIKSNMDSVNYEFQPGFIVRTNTIIDTFKLQVQENNMFFENAPINEVNTINELNRIDELELTIEFENEKIPYHYHKQYSSANLIEKNPNAIN